MSWPFRNLIEKNPLTPWELQDIIDINNVPSNEIFYRNSNGDIVWLTAGTNLTIDETDPDNPVINATWWWGGITEEDAIVYALIFW